MRKIKGYIAATLSATMILGMAGCSQAGGDEAGTEATEAVTEAIEATEAEEEVASDDTPAVTDDDIVLTGTGPATLDEIFATEEGSSAQLKNGDVLVDINFDDNDVDGFVTYTNGGSMDLSAKDGQLVATIKSVGGLDYADQIYWDGFGLSEHCIYTYSFDISSDIERKVEYRLQLNGGDYHAYQGELIDVGPEVTNFTVDFEMKEESDPAPRIVFNMGKTEDISSEPGEHNIYIDNIKLEVKDASDAITVSALPNTLNVAVNQLGYAPDDTKVAVVKTDNAEYEPFILCDAETNETVYMGDLGEPIYDYGAKVNTRSADFSDFNVPGKYYIYTQEGSSFAFEIKDDPYKEVYDDVVNMLYKQRCGTETDAEIAGEFAHGACHTQEALIYGDESGKRVDVSGGWHDAGDYGRYVVPGAVTVADLFLANELFDADVLDEARYELDWMLKMQDPESGGVYHKVTGLVFPETVTPEEETADLYLAPISITATADFAAIMAKASVVYKDIDADFSTRALEAAKKAWTYIDGLDKFIGFRNPSEIVTGEYPDDKTLDERYWAAVELYMAGDKSVKEKLDSFANNDMVKQGLGWADVGLYGSYDIAKSRDDALAEIGKNYVVTEADKLVEQSVRTGYFLGFGSNFTWGSNMTVGNHGELLYMAKELTEDEKYSKLAEHQLDYLLGTNALSYCFVTGFGTLYPENPHHRPSQSAGKAMSGMLVGGPDKNLEDPYAIAVLTEESPATSYVDNAQSYSTNEVAIYWNSPLIVLLAGERYKD